MYQTLDLNLAFTLVEPSPVVLITTRDQGKDNVFTLSLLMPLGFDDDSGCCNIAIMTGRWNHSARSMLKNKQCVLHVPTAERMADTIAESVAQDKHVSVCGEMAGDPMVTRLLLGLGLRSFSMHPAQISSIKQRVLRADTRRLAPLVDDVIQCDDPEAACMQAMAGGAGARLASAA